MLNTNKNILLLQYKKYNDNTYQQGKQG
jgi:hypothetical protein